MNTYDFKDEIKALDALAQFCDHGFPGYYNAEEEESEVLRYFCELSGAYAALLKKVLEYHVKSEKEQKSTNDNAL